MTARDTDGAALDAAGRRDAQRRLARCCAARDWDGGAPGETLLFDDGALAHGAWPWAPEPEPADESCPR